MFYSGWMAKRVTPNQLTGEIGETAVRARFLTIGFQFDVRSRLETGIDAIAEVMIEGRPSARMIAVQVKTTQSGKYAYENETSFSYLLNHEDVEYWAPANLPVIVVLHRISDSSYYWKEVPKDLLASGERRLTIEKAADCLDESARDRLAALTVPKTGFGYYVPPLGGGEEALVNVLPISLPNEMFVASTSYDVRKALAILHEDHPSARFDWIIRGGTFWSFHDPRTSGCEAIVDEDQVEAVSTDLLAFHDDEDEQSKFIHLLRETLKHQLQSDLQWDKAKKLLYFRALEKNVTRRFSYSATKRQTHADVVNVTMDKQDETKVSFVRHHAFTPRFELIGDQWFLIVNPTYFFTTNGYTPHSHPAALLSGKKRMDNSASLRGQVGMWHRFLTKETASVADLFGREPVDETQLRFGSPPTIELKTRVPEDVWGKPKVRPIDTDEQERLV